MIKWKDQTVLRKRLVQWVDLNIDSDPYFHEIDFISAWLSRVKIEPLKAAVRQCEELELYNLDYAKDEMSLKI